MRKTDYENRLRNKEIADNEAVRSAFHQARLSTWAVVIACLLVLATIFYFFTR